ncbi:IQ-DOMAIN 14-like protein [Tanacetum coccineum]
MGKTSKFFKSLFGFKPSNPKRLRWTLFKSSQKQHNHDEAIPADGGLVQSRPPSVVAKLMGLEALPDSAITNQKQKMGVTPISRPFFAVASKVLTLFKSSHKQHNHDEAISADRGSVPSRPPSVVAKLMGLEALPDSATTNQKQEMGVTPISPPFYTVTSKVHVSMRRVPFTLAKSESSRRCLSGYSDHPNYMSHTESSWAKLRSLSGPGGRRRSNVQPNDDQHREAVGELKKATYRGTQVSREVSLIEPVSCGGGDLPPGPLPISATAYDTSMIVYYGSFDFTDDSMQVIKDQWEMPDDVIPNTLSFGVSLHEEDDGLKTILWEEELNRAESWIDGT